MIYLLLYYTYFASLAFATACSIYRFKLLDSGSKVISILVCCALINEGVAYYFAKKFHNNLPVYSIYCLLEYGLLCLYFNNIIDVFIKKNIGMYIGLTGILLGLLNLTFLQHWNSYNSNFLFLEDLAVIGMSLFAFFRLLLKHDALNLFKYHHFWFICILIFFWSITFLNWGLYNYFNLKLQHAAWKINFGITVVGVITYLSLGCVFLLYPKIQSKNG